METIRDDWWLAEFSPVASGPVDYLSRDGKMAVAVQRAAFGSRGLYSAVLQLSIFLERNPSVEKACLVLSRTRMSLPRMQAEWEASKKVLRSSIARRLSVVVMEAGTTWVDPDEPDFRRIAHAIEFARHNGQELLSGAVRQPPGQKTYEVVKILLNRWLQGLGPIPVGELSAQAGCSYPTVRKALDKPSVRSVLSFTSSRSVEFRAFPHDAWRELIALSGTLRGSLQFRDRSGDKPSPQGLLRRLERARPPHVALGGVIAARHWHSDFDLHGTPRLDVEYHAPNGIVVFDFVKELDPALTQTSDPTEAAILVIHPLVRAASMFREESRKRLPWADPVETALDLCELSLTSQANQLLTHLRPEVRLA